MNVIHTLLSDVQVIKSPAFVDDRGGFVKLFNQQDTLLQHYSIQQVNFVQNKQASILRGLHYQSGDWAESKFFRVIKGRIQLAFVDLRQAPFNPTKVGTFVLDKPEVGVLVPRGFATGYLTLEEDSDVLYYSDNVYHPSSERGLRWDDPLFNIPWLNRTPNLSKKDKAWADFKETI